MFQFSNLGSCQILMQLTQTDQTSKKLYSTKQNPCGVFFCFVFLNQERNEYWTLKMEEKELEKLSMTAKSAQHAKSPTNRDV